MCDGFRDYCWVFDGTVSRELLAQCFCGMSWLDSELSFGLSRWCLLQGDYSGIVQITVLYRRLLLAMSANIYDLLLCKNADAKMTQTSNIVSIEWVILSQ